MKVPLNFKLRMKVLNSIFWLGFYSRCWTNLINRKKIETFNSLLGKNFQDVINSFREYKEPTDKEIGNRVWVFWYSGINTAPLIVQRCIASIEEMEGADVIILDKNNLDSFFCWDPVIKDKFQNGQINIQTISDIIRNQLLSKYGGFWFDATLLVFDSDFVKKHGHLQFYSLRHSDYAACSHFSGGRWSTFLIGSVPGNILCTFTSAFYKRYFEIYDSPCDYFLTDYIYFLAYKTFPDLTNTIDSLPIENSDVFFIGRNIKKSCSIKEILNIVSSNQVQKLSWKSCQDLPKYSGTYYSFVVDGFSTVKAEE